jgi:hypothetical protein
MRCEMAESVAGESRSVDTDKGTSTRCARSVCLYRARFNPPGCRHSCNGSAAPAPLTRNKMAFHQRECPPDRRSSIIGATRLRNTATAVATVPRPNESTTPHPPSGVGEHRFHRTLKSVNGFVLVGTGVSPSTEYRPFVPRRPMMPLGVAVSITGKQRRGNLSVRNLARVGMYLYIRAPRDLNGTSFSRISSPIKISRSTEIRFEFEANQTNFRQNSSSQQTHFWLQDIKVFHTSCQNDYRFFSAIAHTISSASFIHFHVRNERNINRPRNASERKRDPLNSKPLKRCRHCHVIIQA